jgi:integrase
VTAVASIRYRTRKDGSVYVQVLCTLDGKQSSTAFDDPADAEWLRDLINRIGPAKALEIARRRDRTPDAMTVAEYLTHHINHLTGVERRTIEDYRKYVSKDIAPVLGDIPLTALTSEDIAQWLQGLRAAGASAKTILNKHGFLSGALNAAVPARIPANPAAGQKLYRDERQEMVFLSRDQFALLLKSVTEPWRPFVEFLVASGCRLGEATALRPGDVDRTDGTVNISRAWKHSTGHWEIGPPKTRMSHRTINLPTSVLNKLDYNRDWLFVNRTGGPIRHHGFRARVWWPAVQRSGLDPTPRIHDLRHTCASWMIAAGVPLPVIQRHLGHESIETTVGVYGHLDRSSARAAAAAIEAALTKDDTPTA